MLIQVRCVFLGLVMLSACGNAATASDGGACTGPLSEVRRLWSFECPDDYATVLEPMFGCDGQSPQISIGAAGDLLVARFHYGTHGGTCFYDPTTRRLVGALKFDDIPSFCNRSSSEIRAGTAPGGCTGPLPTGCDLTRIDRHTDCLSSHPDGGPDGA
jgi:hypothetical protein